MTNRCFYGLQKIAGASLINRIMDPARLYKSYLIDPKEGLLMPGYDPKRMLKTVENDVLPTGTVSGVDDVVDNMNKDGGLRYSAKAGAFLSSLGMHNKINNRIKALYSIPPTVDTVKRIQRLQKIQDAYERGTYLRRTPFDSPINLTPQEMDDMHNNIRSLAKN